VTGEKDCFGSNYRAAEDRTASGPAPEAPGEEIVCGDLPRWWCRQKLKMFLC